MVILLHDYGGYPFIFDLSQELSKYGHQVYHVYSSASGSPSKNVESSESLKIIDLAKNLKPVDKSSFISRFLQENKYGDLIVDLIDKVKPDVVISGNTPLEAQYKLVKVCKANNIFVIHWLQDFLSIAAKNVLSKKNKIIGGIVGKYFHHKEKRCLQLSDHVVSISDDFTKILSEWGIDDNKVSEIMNWSSVDSIPLIPKSNFFAIEHNLVNTFNIVYSGTMGMKQNPNALLEIAKHFKNDPKVRVVIVGKGAAVEYIEEQKEKYQLNNLLIFPLQPYDTLPNLLGLADVLVATLESDAAAYCVPSKVLTYYCAGKPVLLFMSNKNLASRITIANNLGFVSDPSDDIKHSFSFINKIINDDDVKKEYGVKARQFAEENFKIKLIADKFNNIIEKSRI